MKKNTNKLPEIVALDKRFKNIFGVRFLKFIDASLARQGYGAHLDIVAFDHYLCHRHDNYTEEMSMNEFLEKEYGKEVKQFIEELI